MALAPGARARTVTSGGTPVAVAARVDDGEQDGIDSDGWVTLARPAAGPFVGHRNHTRLQQASREHAVPYTDALTEDDLADTVHGGFQYRLRKARSGRRPS